MIFAGFSEGFREQGEKNYRRRQELAKAFEDFKRNNPYATFAEYQAFIDQRVGGGSGANYLRGGVPSADILRQLAKDNANRKRKEEARARVTDLAARGQLVGQMQGDVDGFLMTMEDEDFDGAYAKFIGQYGDNAEELFQGMNLRNYFTPKYRDQLIGNRLIDMTPKISQYVNATGGRVNDPAAFANYLGIPKGQIQPFLDVASEEYDRKVTSWEIQNNERVVRTINNEIAAGRDPKPAVARLLRGAGIGPDDFNIAAAETEAKRIRTLEEAERQRKREESQYKLRADMADNFRKDSTIKSIIKLGNEARATEIMLDRARNRLTDEAFKTAYGVSKEEATPALFTKISQSIAAEAVTEQINDQNSRRDNFKELASSLSAQAIKDNQTNTINYFKNTYGNGYAAIARLVASTHFIDANMRIALEEAFNKIPENLKAANNSTDISQFVLNYPAVLQAIENGTLIEDYELQSYDAMVGKFGVFNVESFDAWHKRSYDDIMTNFGDIQKDIDRAVAISNPTERLEYLETIQNGLQNFVNDVNTHIKQRGDSASHWVEYGTGGWNGAKADELTRLLAQNENAIATSIQTAMDDAEAKIGAMAQVPLQPSLAPSQTQSAGGRALNEHSMNVDAVRAISEAVGFALQDSTTANPFAAGYDLAAALARLIGREVKENFMMPEAEEERREAMRKWVGENSTSLISIYAHADDDGKEKMLEDLKIMTQSEFEAKYQAQLKQYKDGKLRRVESLMPLMPF